MTDKIDDRMLTLYPQLGLPPMTDAERKRMRRRGTKRGGYIAQPGSGPDSETCGTCKHIARFDRWRKCRLAQARWTGGPGTDILVGSPACAKWEKAP